MVSPAVHTRQAEAEDLSALSDVLARAFVDDPMFVSLAPRDDRMQDRLRTMFTGVLKYISNDLSDTLTTADRDGVAVWNPPGYKGPRGSDGLRMLPHMAGLMGWRRIHLMMSALNRLDKRHEHHMPEPHWYLLALAVAPGRQGQGIGSALMRPLLERCDQDRLPAYLETATPRNLPLYERHGFVTVEELHIGRQGVGVPVWLMRREPAASPE